MEKDRMRYFELLARVKHEHARLLAEYPELADLTQREFEIFAQLLTDKIQAQIDAELYISHSSVHFHCKNIYKKLNINSRRQLLIRYCNI